MLTPTKRPSVSTRIFHDAGAEVLLPGGEWRHFIILICFVFHYFVFAGGGPRSIDRAALKQDQRVDSSFAIPNGS